MRAAGLGAASVVVLAALTSTAVGAESPTAPAAPVPGTTYTVEQITFPVEPITFGDASADGSLTDDGRGQITLLSDVFFDYNSATLNPKAQSAIQAVAKKLAASGAKAVKIEGHTDADGADAYNLSLSQKRAEAVRAALAPSLPGITLTTQGLSEQFPVADNTTEAGKAKNRRVTLTVQP